MPKEKQVKLNYPQSKFIFSNDLNVCIKGTWGCGKSLAGLIAANIECENIPNNLYLIIRKEYCDLRDSTMKDWDAEFGDRHPIVGNDVRYPNGSVLMFRHGDDINALKNANLGGALMIQAEEMCEEDFYFLRGRLRRKEGTRQLRLECNYDGHNWIYKLFNEMKIGELITTNTFDNEMNLPADYIESLKKLPDRMQRIHLYGSDEESTGLVFDEFRAHKHLIAPYKLPTEFERVFALDHGLTNPTAVLWGAIDYDGKIYIFDEHYEAGKLISYHSAQIKLRGNASTRFIDPSCFNKIASQNRIYSIAEEYADNGIQFQPANNEVLAGINRVNEYFKSDMLFIFKNCTNTIREIESYKWKELKPGSEHNRPEEPVKRNDHAMDALRYLVMSRPQATAKPPASEYKTHDERIFDNIQKQIKRQQEEERQQESEMYI
jgi:phage terminase large subunit